MMMTTSTGQGNSAHSRPWECAGEDCDEAGDDAHVPHVREHHARASRSRGPWCPASAGVK